MAETVVEVDVSADCKYVINRLRLDAAVRAALRAGGWCTAGRSGRGPTIVSLHLTGDKETRELNRRHRGVDKPTDVLSFSFIATASGPEIVNQDETPVSLGEIILNCGYAERQAAELGYPLETELAWLTIHGTLQLLGYEHDTDERATRMEALEREALADLGITVD